MEESTYVLGIDIGGTKIALCVADNKGNILASDRLKSGALTEYSDTLADIIALAKRLIADAKLTLDDIKACGISAPGPLDIANGLILKSPNMNWYGVPIRDDIHKALGLPVILENDANAGVLAEYFFGSAKGKKDVIYITMSTGVGGGILSGGKLITGTSGNAGELGHVVLDINGPLCGCGQRGCLESYCGGRNVAERLRELLKDKPNHAMFKLPCVDGKVENLNFQAVREGAKAGIPLAMEMWDEICLRLAQGLGQMMSTFNPEMIILGTSAYYAGDYLLQPVLKYLPRFAWSDFRNYCEIKATELGPKVGELSGASVALHYLFN